MSSLAVSVGLALTALMQGDPAALLTLHLDKPSVIAGQKVTLNEWVPASMPGKVTRVSHACSRVARYDGPTRKMVDEPISVRLRSEDAFTYLGGLPVLDPNHSGFIFTDDGSGRKGVSYTFSPPTPGVYQIHADWKVTGIEGPPSGSNGFRRPPVTLTVLPEPPAKAP